MTAKEVAIGKRAKISEAQQYMLLAVLGASVVLGVAIALTVHFIKQISFNTEVIMAEDKAIVSYSDVIKTTGICEKPKGEVYSDKELNDCDPNSIEISQIEGTLRYNILENLADNSALNSVPKEDNSICKDYTFAELKEMYNDAKNSSDAATASQLIKSCSALRIIPDALPAFKNEEALLASLNKLFLESGWQPESLSPGSSSSLSNGLNAISLKVSIEGDASTTMGVLNNIERSIREFDIERATIEWGSNNTLSLQAQATAYYMDESSITEATKTLKAEGGKK